MIKTFLIILMSICLLVLQIDDDQLPKASFFFADCWAKQNVEAIL